MTTARQWLMATLDGTPGWEAIEGRMYPRGSLGIGGNPPDPNVPYGMYALGFADSHPEVRETRKTVTQSLRIYIYDRKGSYTRIDDIHRLVRETLETTSGSEAGGWRCTNIEFTSLGEETTDGSNNLRIATYRLTGTQ